MCGITGIFHYGLNKPVESQALEHMTDVLAHRGPDDRGVHIDGAVGLGHRRLSIIDLTDSGRQPMPNANQDVWIAYNGECYNYQTHTARLKSKGYSFTSSSDTEALLHLYEEEGTAFLNSIDGMFALAIWDKRKQTLLLARDRVGIKPLYYYDNGETILFASELKAFLDHPEFKKELDYAALGNYFRFMSIPDPQCIFKNVRKLLPGHSLTVSAKGTALSRYWDVESFEASTSRSFDEASEEFEARFSGCVTSHMVSDVPMGAFLSGGVDSSGVVAYASALSEPEIQTFSVSFAGHPEYDESPFAQLVADRYNTKHHAFSLEPNFIKMLPKMVWHSDEPFAVSSSFPLFMLAEQASRSVKVVLTGDGADELFAGYPWRHASAHTAPDWLTALASPVAALLRGVKTDRLPPSHFLRRIKRMVSPAEMYSSAFACFHLAEVANLLTGDALEAFIKASIPDPVVDSFDAPHSASVLNRRLYAEMKTTLVSEMLTKVDRMTMAFGLEARVPFLDHALVEWAFGLPDDYKILGNDGKRIVKNALNPKLPETLLNRPKHGFNVPLPVWLRGELREWVREILSEQRLRERGIFNPTAVNRMLDSFDNGNEGNANRILILLCLELWFDQFFDRNS